MDVRQQRGIELADKVNIRRIGKGVGGERGMWVVPSATGNGRYRVDLDGVFPSCTCPDHENRLKKCKHIYAAETVYERQTVTETTKTTTEPSGKKTVTKTKTTTTTKRTTYKQNWPAYNTAQTTEKAHFQKLLHDLCQSVPDMPRQDGVAGRNRIPLGDMVFASAYKVYSTVSGRRFMTDLTLAYENGHLSKLPCYNSLFNYMEMEELTPVLKELIETSSLPLKAIETNFAVDASGFSTCKTVTWFNTRYGHDQTNADWLKLHLMCGVKTNVVTAADTSDRWGHDSPYFVPLVESTAKNFTINEVSADKAYSSRKNLAKVDGYGGMPFIPFKSNAGDGGNCGVWRLMYYYYQLSREAFLMHYHKRSNVESTFSMIKAKFGPALRSKTDTAMINEALCKVLCHNICCVIQSIHELGIEADFNNGFCPKMMVPAQNYA